MYAGDGVIWLHPETDEFRLASPATVGRATSMVAVMVDDVDDHHRSVLAKGGDIVYPPTDQPYGYREYSARDCEGTLWSFMRHSALNRTIRPRLASVRRPRHALLVAERWQPRISRCPARVGRRKRRPATRWSPRVRIGRLADQSGGSSSRSGAFSDCCQREWQRCASHKGDSGRRHWERSRSMASRRRRVLAGERITYAVSRRDS